MTHTSPPASLSKPGHILCRDFPQRKPGTPSPNNDLIHDRLRADNERTRPSSARSVHFFSKLIASFPMLKHSSTPNSSPNPQNTQPKSALDLDNYMTSCVFGPTEPQLSYQQNTSPQRPYSKSNPAKPTKSNSQILRTTKSSTQSYELKTQPVSKLELTPLSRLIEQSYRDLQMLRGVPITKTSDGTEGSNNNRSGKGLLCRLPNSGGKQVDLSKIEENLKRFEDLYAQFLNGEKESDPTEEVHLVAIVCKQSQFITGIVEPPIKYPKRTAAAGCGN
ncbi:hypothetical protein GcM3_184017 [Golovinomyces cichoracearum]|uniref:Uncharacterized protein n=1 Tax=Golovinomyces cichoracearum TaxID=62708 RepID=A0A420HKN3_9PEZI|nr:hypothetical protein GcM3_184017 [Golovinomyces cichoracearum]